MVRHIIDKKSPMFGHTMKTLKDGDASFSLTIMSLERTSMQPIFHLQVSHLTFSFAVIISMGIDTPSSRGSSALFDYSRVGSLKHFCVYS